MAAHPARVRRGIGPLSGHRKLARRKARAARYKPDNLLHRFLALTVLVIFVSLVWQVFSSWQGRLWKQERRFTVVVAGKDPTVFSFDPQTRTLSVVIIPSNTQIEAAGGYGFWLVGSLWELGQQEGLGGTLLVESLKKSFGIPIDGFVDPRGETLFSLRSLAFPLSVKEAVLSGRVSTNLTFFDRLNVLLGPGSVGQADRNSIDLRESRVLRQSVLSDGTQGFEVVSEQTEASFARLFRDERVFTEGKTLSVVNTTGKAGLASEVARLARVLGVRVIKVGSSEAKVDACKIRGARQDLDSFSARRLVTLLGCPLEEGIGELAQLELILGEGFARRF